MRLQLRHALVALTLTLTALPATTGTTAYAAPAGVAAAEQAKAAPKASSPQLSKQCAATLRSPRKPVRSSVFAACTVTSMKTGRTVVVRTAMSDGSVGVGPYRFTATTDASVKANDGSRQVALGKGFWVKPKGGTWVKAKATGSRAQRDAHLAGQLWRGLASAAAFKRYLGSSTEPWRPTGRTKKINGVKAHQYSGMPRIDGLDFAEYHVWIDRHHRPIRVAYRATAFGTELSMKQDYSKWGSKVSIKAPTTR